MLPEAISEAYRTRFALLPLVRSWSSRTHIYQGAINHYYASYPAYRKNSDYTFFYNAADLEDKQRKDINCNGPIDEILDEVFKDSGISYIVKNKEVILNVQKTNNTQQKKKRTVTGTIIDAVDDSPIIGANITIKGDKNTGTISDIDGNFSLSIPDNKTILVVTYIGYKTREVPVEDLGNIKIVLEGDDHTLNEVVVVGSGTQRRSA